MLAGWRRRSTKRGGCWARRSEADVGWLELVFLILLGVFIVGGFLVFLRRLE
jgi:hypothetical protein